MENEKSGSLAFLMKNRILEIFDKIFAKNQLIGHCPYRKCDEKMTGQSIGKK